MTLSTRIRKIFLALMTLTASVSFAQDPNFHIYLAFGQSNMDGAGAIEAQDKQGVDARFKNMSSVTCNERVLGEWYTGDPPLGRCTAGLSPVDYFGRTLVDALPSQITVGVAVVAVAGSKIELFDKQAYKAYADTAPSWMQGWISEFGGNPYARLVEVGKKAQQVGVIKGILLHQGESNSGDQQWPNKVKKIYDDLMNDLNLDPTKVALLAGELVSTAEGGKCGGHNAIIARLPSVIPNAHVISSAGLPDGGDGFHFTSASYRIFGKRYAETMLTLLDKEPVNPPTPENVWLEVECATTGKNWQLSTASEASNGMYLSPVSGLNSLESAPTGSDDRIEMPFTIDSAQNFKLYARVNLPSGDDDSYWIQMDEGSWETFNNATTTNWEWVQLNQYDLSVGSHTLRIAYREDGALLDKINISNASSPPTDTGEHVTCQVPVANTSQEIIKNTDLNHVSVQGNHLEFDLQLAHPTLASLTVFALNGTELGTIRRMFVSGQTYSMPLPNLTPGIYIVALKTPDQELSRTISLVNF